MQSEGSFPEQDRGCGGRGPYAYSIEGRYGIEMRGSCAGKRRRQHRVPGSWKKCKLVANGECGEARRRDLLGDKAENGGSCRSTQSFRGVQSRFMQRP